MGEKEQREVFKTNLNKLLEKNHSTQKEIAEKIGVSPQTFNTWTQGKAIPRMGKIQKLADYFGINKSDLINDPKDKANSLSTSVVIPVLGSVPAGIPLDAIEDIIDYEEIPQSWTNGEREFFALKVKGDSMIPKYIEGDIIIVRKASDCESGQDCVVYVNGYDATLKKVIKKQDHIILQPLNPSYEPKMFDYNDEANPISIAGIVVEIRRKL